MRLPQAQLRGLAPAPAAAEAQARALGGNCEDTTTPGGVAAADLGLDGLVEERALG